MYFQFKNNNKNKMKLYFKLILIKQIENFKDQNKKKKDFKIKKYLIILKNTFII